MLPHNSPMDFHIILFQQYPPNPTLTNDRDIWFPGKNSMHT